MLIIKLRPSLHLSSVMPNNCVVVELFLLSSRLKHLWCQCGANTPVPSHLDSRKVTDSLKGVC